jgi:cytochrome c553
MSRAPAISRLGIALLIGTALVACSRSQVASTDNSDSSLPGLPTGRVSAGEQLAHAPRSVTGQSCVDCHGSDGNAPIAAIFPKLGGQYPDYLAHALQAYRKGDRQHPMMAPQAATLSDQDIADLAAYFASRQSQLRDLQGVN